MTPPDYDPRIVDLYDGDNPDGPDHDYFRRLAEQSGAQRVLDVGCGTGLLTVTLTAPGRTVVGLDPSAAMLDYARDRPGADAVTWIGGDSSDLPGGDFDLILMTGNVAQHIPGTDWTRTLRDLRRVSHAGTVLAFESRNPVSRAWESWSVSTPTTRETMHGPLSEWSDVTMREDGQVLLRSFNRFEDSGDVVQEDLLLTSRSVDKIRKELRETGFDVTAVWGDWFRTPFDGTQPVMVFEARAH